MQSKCWKFGNNISTDEIISTQYMVLSEAEKLAEHIFENISSDFAKNVSKGDILVAGDNFGYGSSREHAVMAIKGAGIKAVVAKSFARIFFRNSINLGLMIINCDEASERIQEGDMVELDVEKSIIKNLSRNEEYHFDNYPDFILEYFKNDGLINTINKKNL